MRNLKFKKLNLLYLVLGVVLLEFAGLRTYQLSTDEHYYGWPAVTQCRLCNETVWEWQKYERRKYNVHSNYWGVSSSGLVHNKCEGVPSDTIMVNFK